MIGKTRRRNPDGRRPVTAYTAKQLHEILVADAVKRHPTDLVWAVEAYDRIGQQTGHGAEVAYMAVCDEVYALTGSRLMPMG